ncbi:MAG: hypothetical protein E6R03_08270 [Hyphomicrobiaceae bacterium]|nr:MAG: hypothetical protein E6R03_08270 [Hyphomicrobiaceae bacterium]
MNEEKYAKQWQTFDGLCLMFDKGDKRLNTIPEFLDGFGEDLKGYGEKQEIARRARMLQILQTYTPDILDEAYDLAAQQYGRLAVA